MRPIAELKRHVEAFGFIIGVQPRLFRNQSPVNRKASELMGRLHNALAADGYTGYNLERLLVRLLFILFADDTGIFERKDMFLTWLEGQTTPDGRDLGAKLGMLFQVLDTPPEKRQRGLDADLAEFPYINGELFRERIDMPAFDNAMRDMLLDASMFNWGEVSPAIFGSLFESVIDKVTRRKQGAHYTPEQAILKVIEPLFLDDLRAEFERLKALKSGRERALRAFHERLGALTFLDPACGAGNFLVVAYRELRELERELLKELLTINGKVELVTDVAMLSRLNVDRLFGIEIDEFPAMIAQVALWMTDHIANTRLAEDFGQHYARIPLVTAPGIRHADALELDWNAVLPAERCSFVFGNPPFVGAKYQTEAQRAQVRRLAALPGSGGTLDYVAAWFIKAARYVAAGETRILTEEPGAEPLFRRFVGGDEYINGFYRWILYLADATPTHLRQLPHVRQRVSAVREYRLGSSRPSTIKMADEPMRLGVDERLTGDYLVIPNTSSERREYVPIGWLGPDVIANQKLRILPDATLWQFGALTSRMHMAWMRQITGRMKSDYMYSFGVVYNNFPWPDATPAQRAQIEALAQAVLDARALPKNGTSTLADLYDPHTMPAELRRAHRELDTAVDRLYRRAPFGSDRERVEHLFTLYQRLVDPLQNEGVRQNRRVARRKAKADATE